MEDKPEVRAVVAAARAFAASLGLDLGPLASCRHVTRALVREQLRDADPDDPAYENGVRLAQTMRDRWAVHFDKKFPPGVFESPSTVCVHVFDDTGEVCLG